MKKFYLLLSMIVLMSELVIAQNNFQVVGEGSFITGMSRNGQRVVGYIPGAYSFIWNSQDGQIKEITPDIVSEAHAVANDGTIAGLFADSTYMYKDWDDSYVPLQSAGYYKDGKWHSLGINPAIAEVNSESGSSADAISADGSIVGGSIKSADGSVLIPCVWKNGVLTQYEYVNAGQGAKVMSLSDDGNVACGWAAPNWNRTPVVWVNGQLRKITYNGMVGPGEASSVSPNGKYVALQINSRAAIYVVDEDRTIVLDDQETAALGSSCSVVSNDGTAYGYAQINYGYERDAFVFNEKIGLYNLDSYLQELGVSVPEGTIISTPMGISTDGTRIGGFGLSADYATIMWLLDITNPLDVRNRPQNLSAEELTKGNVTLAWTAPASDGAHVLTGYNVYKDGVKVNGSVITTLTYADNSLAPGKYSYSISAVWDGDKESKQTEKAQIGITGSLPLPFHESFESASLDTHYWVVNPASSANWATDSYAGIFAPGLVYMPPSGTLYNESLSSAYFDATAYSDLYVSFNISSSIYQLSGENKMQLQVFDGSEWHLIKEYPAKDMSSFEYKEENISSVAAGKVIRIRLVGTGNNTGGSLVWTIDNIRIYSSSDKLTVDAPSDLSAKREEKNEAVSLHWFDSKGVATIGYGDSSDYAYTIGDEGVPFIAAIEFKAGELASYDGYYLKSIMGYPISYYLDAADMPEYKLVAFQDGVKVLDQAITSYKRETWNEFEIATPIVLDSSKSLILGLEVTKHKEDDLPIILTANEVTTDSFLDGRSNLISEDNGATWTKLTSYTDEYNSFNWTLGIRAKVQKVQGSATAKDGILGYRIYRNGEALNDITVLNNFVDASPLDAASCYKVTTFYDIQEESLPSNEVCLEGYSSISNATEDPDSQIGVYPNPVADVLNIEGSFVDATLYNAQGLLVLKIKSNKTNIESLPAGAYLLTVNLHDGKVVTKKVVKK